MKAVRQIIDYFRERGVLTREQLLELAAEGFLPWDGLIDDADTAGPAAEPPAPPEEDESYQVSYPLRLKPPHRARRAHPRGAVLDADELAQRLRALAADWPAALTGLVSVGRRLGAAASWEEAARAVRNAEPARLDAAVAHGLEQDDPTLAALWDAINLDTYRTAIDGEAVHGRAVSAYRAVLATFDHSGLGKHAWILKEEPVAQVCNLMAAQHRLLCSCESIFSHRPEDIVRAVHRDHHGLAYWMFVLLYTARRGRPGARPPAARFEHRPPRKPPDGESWLRVWCQAVGLDPKAVTALFLELHFTQIQRPDALKRVLEQVLRQAGETARTVVRLCCQPPGLSDSAVAARLGIPEAEVRQGCAWVRQALYEALHAEPVLRHVLGAEPPETQSLLIEECLCAGPDALTDVADRYFGPTADLLCPKVWD